MDEDYWTTDPQPPESPPRYSRRRRGRRRLLTLLAVLGAAAIVAGSTFAAASVGSNAATTSSSTVTTAVAVTAPATQTKADTSNTPVVNATASSSALQTATASPAKTVLEKAYGSVVNISVTASAGRRSATGIGSGVIYTSDGYILTNDHVVTLDGAVSSGQSITVTFSDGSTAPATVVGEDSNRDIALIKVAKTGLTPVAFASSSTVQLGDWATVIGSPLDYQNSVTLGIVSGLNRSLQVSQSQTLSDLIQIDAPISPGNSGGGCFNALGQFIGMPELYLPPGSTGAENIGFAIPSDIVASVAQSLVK